MSHVSQLSSDYNDKVSCSKDDRENVCSDRDLPVCRQRQLTEKGRVYQLDLNQKKRSNLDIQIRKRILLMEELVENGQPDLLRKENEKLNHIFEEYTKIQGICQGLVHSDEEKANIADSLNNYVHNCQRRFVSWLNKHAEEDLSKITQRIVGNHSCSNPLESKERFEEKQSQAASIKSKSSINSETSRSSMKLRIKEERARLAELKIEAAYLKKQELSQMEELQRRKEAEMKSRQLYCEIEMAKANAKLKVYETECEDSNVGVDGGDMQLDGQHILNNIPKDDMFTQNYVQRVSFDRFGNEGDFHPTRNDFTMVQVDSTQFPTETSFKARESRNELLWKDKEKQESNVQREKFIQRENPTLDETKRYNYLDKREITATTEITEALKHLQAPDVELDIFSGNPVDFQYFMATFVQAVERKISDSFGRLTRLIKYTQGEAKEVIKSCIYLPAEECYLEAKRRLQERYGDPYRVSSEYRKQLAAWPKLKPNDPQAYVRFLNFLNKFQASMKLMLSPSLYNPELIQMLQSKLPSFLQDRWNRTAFKVRRASGRPVNLSDFIHFLDEETLIVEDPLYSRTAMSDLNKQGMDKRGLVKSLVTTAKEPQKDSCQLCSKDHDIEDCIDYLEKSLVERRKLLFQKRLCFCCLKRTTKTHSAKSCRNRRKCKHCGQNHPSTLHGYKNTEATLEKKETPATEQGNITTIVSNNCTKTSTEVISLCIVPVKVFHQSSPTIVETFALLDNGSQGTFIHDDIVEKLQAPGVNTSLTIKTMTGEETEKCIAIDGLNVAPLYVDENVKGIDVKLPRTFSRKELPVDFDEVPTAQKLEKWTYLQRIHRYIPKLQPNLKIGLLIGGNCPKAMEPLEVIPSKDNGPYAFRSNLGWCIAGPMMLDKNTKRMKCNKITVKAVGENRTATHYFRIQDEVKDISLKEMLLSMYKVDFNEFQDSSVKVFSQEDRKFMELMKKDVKMMNGHYYLPLPFREDNVNIPNNRQQALQRASWLQRRLERNKDMHRDYVAFMNNMFKLGYARKAPKESVKGKTWYVPHHGIYNPNKPGKIRVVFDCSAKFRNKSLNTELLQGPDMACQLVGVLHRFRQEPVAVTADIESMFYQVRVPEEYRDFLRFVWWPDGDFEKSLEDYQMCVHIFGGISSPSCANFALKRTADDNEARFGEDIAHTLKRNFYVDDMLKSLPDDVTAIHHVNKVVKMCKSGGFRLTKFVSNKKAVLDTVPESERAKTMKELTTWHTTLPMERALGVQWCIHSDTFCFRIVLDDKPLTRRGILSSISSVYDPLGFAAPFLLSGKKLLQRICSERKGWDEEVSSEQRTSWEKWRRQLVSIQNIQVKRCFKPENFGDIVDISLHHFSDASQESYGQVSYIRLEDINRNVCCSIVIGKSRVAPLKRITIPRLELTAATVSVRVATSLRKELEIGPVKEYFWTDSQVVLGYISNKEKRFHLFVANRVQFIQEESRLEQWNYVPTKSNPADDASRGLTFEKYSRNKRWTDGPEFLWKSREHWPKQTLQYNVREDDDEVKKVKINTVVTNNNTDDLLYTLENRFSNWEKLTRVVARILGWKKHKKEIEVGDIEEAKIVIIKMVQAKAFKEELKVLDNFNEMQLSKKKLKRGSRLFDLDAFIDSNGVIRVGGRLKRSNLEFGEVHPIILPRGSNITKLIIQSSHQRMQHAGRGITLNDLRSKGFWIINGTSLVRYIISKCVTCRILRGKAGKQKMSDLPADRLSLAAPFTYCGVDLFGPFMIKERRAERKKYVVLFTCLSSRAVHLESTSLMDTDSFIQALRRFIGRRGQVRMIRSDNGTNFVGADNEMKRALKKMDEDKIAEFLLVLGADWISWKRNPPSSSHFGGVWERQIRSARAILSSLLRTHGSSLGDEEFQTLLVEVEAIINSRPLTTDNLSDVSSPKPLSPSNLLTMKSSVVLPPPGIFQKADLYCRKRWRRIQHLANEFWSRFRKEYIQTLQVRRKWQHPQRNFVIGDVVLLKEDNVLRNNWKMFIVEDVFPDNNGIVRSVLVRNGATELRRPITKLVLILESENVIDSPTRSQADD